MITREEFEKWFANHCRRFGYLDAKEDAQDFFGCLVRLNATYAEAETASVAMMEQGCPYRRDNYGMLRKLIVESRNREQRKVPGGFGYSGSGRVVTREQCERADVNYELYQAEVDFLVDKVKRKEITLAEAQKRAAEPWMEARKVREPKRLEKVKLPERKDSHNGPPHERTLPAGDSGLEPAATKQGHSALG